MRIAIPVSNGRLAAHFGHCEVFAMLTVDETAGTITATENLPPPPHEPGVLPGWLAAQGANRIFAGGMGGRAQSLFAEQGIEVTVGVAGGTPEEVVGAWLKGNLQSGDNLCDH